MLGIWVLVATGARAGEAERALVRGWLEKDARPNPAEVMHVPLEDIEAVVGEVGSPDASEAEVNRLFEGVLTRLRARFPAARKILFARDCEFLYDAAIASAPPEERKLWFLIPVSREVAKRSSASALANLVDKHGMPKDAPLDPGSVIWLDTGARGTIYNHLFSKLIGRLPEAEQPRLSRAVVPLLLQSRGQGSHEPLGRWLDQGERDADDILAYLANYVYYEELDHQFLSSLGISSSFQYRSRWLVDNVEHTPKWTQRWLYVDDAGTLYYEGMTRYTGTIDRPEHLRRMVRTLRHFRPKECSSALKILPNS